MILWQLIWWPRRLLRWLSVWGVYTTWRHRTKGGFKSSQDRAGQHEISSHCLARCTLYNLWVVDFQNFSLIDLDHSWLHVTETTDSKTVDKGGLLWWAHSMELVNAFCIEPRLIVQAYLFLLLFLFCFIFLDFLLKLRAGLLKSYVPLNSFQSPT